MTTASTDPIAQVWEWLLERHPDLEELTHDMDLFEYKLIDSISFVEYVLLIEELSGKNIPASADMLSRLSSLEKVQKHYFASVS